MSHAEGEQAGRQRQIVDAGGGFGVVPGLRRRAVRCQVIDVGGTVVCGEVVECEDSHDKGDDGHPSGQAHGPLEGRRCHARMLASASPMECHRLGARACRSTAAPTEQRSSRMGRAGP